MIGNVASSWNSHRHRNPKSDVFVYNLRLPTGEDFPLLCRPDGAAVPLATRYAFYSRERSLAASTLYKAMLRLAELYSGWESLFGDRLDERLTNGPMPTPSEMDFVLRWDRLPGIDGRLRNERVLWWCAYLTWVADPRHWRYVARDDALHSPAERAERCTAADDVRTLLHDRLISFVGTERSDAALPPNELAAIEDHLLEAVRLEDAQFQMFPRSCDAPLALTLAFRNWLLYAVQRYLGLRVGEALKLTEEDLPSLEDLQAPRWLGQRAPHIRIQRRPHDPTDTRRRGGVKRMTRLVPVAKELVLQLWHYRARLPVSVRAAVPYIFVSMRARPLSYSRAHELALIIAATAATAFDTAYPGVRHSVARFHWHRLRHTHAEEMVTQFFPDGVNRPDALRRFLKYFGWSSERAAWPYIAGLEAERGEALLAQDEHRLRSEMALLGEVSHVR